MLETRQRGINRLFFLLQHSGALIWLWTVYLSVNFFVYDFGLSSRPYVEASLLLLIAAQIEFFTRDNDFRDLSGLSRKDLCSISNRQMLFSLVTIFGTMVMLKDDSLSRIFIAVFFAVYYVWIAWTNRFGFRILHRQLYRNGEKGRSRALLVGSPSEVKRYCSSSESPRPPGTEIMGFIPVGGDGAGASIALPQLGDFTDLRQICEKTKARVLLLLGMHDRKELVQPLSSLSSELGIRTLWIDDVGSGFGTGFRPYHTGKYSVVSQIHEPLEDPSNRFIKRCFDFCFALIGIVLILPPLMIWVAILHRLRSPGPMFFRQERSGRNGEVFRIYKFRTMTLADPEKESDEYRQAVNGDVRVFGGGHFLRRFSLDELPQLINVVRGEMSVVGPRPHPLKLDRRLSSQSAIYRLRNLAKPGITGLAQSRGWRGETKSDQQIRNRVRLDLFYIRNWSFLLDLRIIVETVAQVIRPPKSAC